MIKFIPNILTLGRLVLSVLFLIILLYSPKFTESQRSFYLDIAFVFFVVAGLTDIIDGAVARKLNVTSKFGRIVDPLVDKVLICGTFIVFAIMKQPKLFNFSTGHLAVVHWGVATVLIAREVYVTILRHIAEAKGIAFAATSSGKVKMFLQSFAVGTVIIKMAHVPTAAWGWWFTTVTYLIMLAVTVFSGIRATQREAWKKVSVTSAH